MGKLKCLSTLIYLVVGPLIRFLMHGKVQRAKKFANLAKQDPGRAMLKS